MNTKGRESEVTFRQDFMIRETDPNLVQTVKFVNNKIDRFGPACEFLIHAGKQLP